MSEDLSKGHSNIGDFIVNHTKHVCLEVAFKELFLAHCFTAHKNKELSSLECLSMQEVFFDYFGDRVLFVLVIIKLLENVD